MHTWSQPDNSLVGLVTGQIVFKRGSSGNVGGSPYDDDFRKEVVGEYHRLNNLGMKQGVIYKMIFDEYEITSTTVRDWRNKFDDDATGRVK